MVKRIAVGESLESLKLLRKEGLSLRNYMAKFVNRKIATGTHNDSTQHLLDELLDGISSEYNGGEATWATRVLDQVAKDQDKARKHLENIVREQIKRRGYYPEDGSGSRVAKSHTTSEDPEEHTSSDSPYRQSPRTAQQSVPGRPYKTRAGQQSGPSASASGADVNTQGSFAPEEPQGSGSGSSASKALTVDPPGEKPFDKSPVPEPEEDTPFLHTYTYFTHHFEIDNSVQAPQIIRAMITSHEALAAELKQKMMTFKPHQVKQRHECLMQEEFSARLQAMVVAHIRMETH